MTMTANDCKKVNILTEEEKANNEIHFYMQFGGFYNERGFPYTHVSDYAAMHFDKDCGDDLTEEEWEKIDWCKSYENYAKDLIDTLNIYLGTSMRFLDLWSPQYYNYHTDEIHTAIDIDEYKYLRREFLSRQQFRDFVNETSQSRPGWSSHYKGLTEVAADDEILLIYMFNYMFDNEHVHHLLIDLNDDLDYQIAFEEDKNEKSS